MHLWGGGRAFLQQCAGDVQCNHRRFNAVQQISTHAPTHTHTQAMAAVPCTPGAHDGCAAEARSPVA